MSQEFVTRTEVVNDMQSSLDTKQSPVYSDVQN